jgi:hypothetical protein
VSAVSLSVLRRDPDATLYMAPEAIARPDAAGPQSDLYAGAALGYFLLTGQHVFVGGSAVEIYAAHLAAMG